MGDWPLMDGQISEMGGRTGSNSFLTPVTASSSTNTKGSYLELISSTAFQSFGVLVTFGYCDAPAQFLVDIAIGGSGSEIVLIPNLIFGAFDSVKSRHIGQSIFFPIQIPAGVRISARCQCDVASKTIGVGVNLVGGGFCGNAPFAAVGAYGANTGTTGGVSVDPGTTANTKGAWSEISSSLAQAAKGLIIGIGKQNIARLWGEWMVDIAVGGAGSETVIIPNLPLVVSDNAQKVTPQYSPYLPFTIPAGSRVAVRAQSGITSSPQRTFDCIIYGVY